MDFAIKHTPYKQITELIQADNAAQIGVASKRIDRLRGGLSAAAHGNAYGNSLALFDGGAKTAAAADAAVFQELNQRLQSIHNDPKVPAMKYGRESIPPPLADNLSEAGFNFTARGPGAEMRRLKNAVSLALAHKMGYSKTVGAPAQDVQFAVLQKNGTCGVGAQYEALKQRGYAVGMSALAHLAMKLGAYVEISSRYGQKDATSNPVLAMVDGTPFKDANALLMHYHVNSWVVTNAKPKDILNSVYYGGGAIVALRGFKFWRNKDGPKHEGVDHLVYVTGVELRRSSNKILGYYVNDTGTGEGGRYVSAAFFNKAWETNGTGQMVSFVKPRTGLKIIGRHPIG